MPTRNVLIVAIGVLGLWFATTAQATGGSANRSAWFWVSDESDFGSVNVVGNPQRQAEALAIMRHYGFSKLYTSYGNEFDDMANDIDDWNAQLRAASISPQLLLSENTWIFPDQRRQNLLDAVQSRLLDFNNARPATQQFDALHLDIEPHGLDEWKTDTPAQRRTLLGHYADTITAVREHLDNNGGGELPLYVDLPVWYDNVGGSIGWADETDRNNWFDGLRSNVSGITLMAFERSTFSSIQNGVAWEIDRYRNVTRVALAATAIGAGKTWADFDAFEAMAEQIETHYGESAGIDIQNFASFAENAPAVPEPAGAMMMVIAAGLIVRRRKAATSSGAP